MKNYIKPTPSGVNLFYQPEISNGILHLDEEESRHAVKVLRLREGDSIEITDGKGGWYRTNLVQADPKKCSFVIRESRLIPKRQFSIALALAPTKNHDRIEWFVEKSVEVGIEKVLFIECRNSERKSINLARLSKIALSAMKQSGQCWLPEIYAIQPLAKILHEVYDQKFICHVDPKNPRLLKYEAVPGKNYLVLIGPEGDFSPDEVELANRSGFIKVGLGPSRLRTETAALSACQTLNFINL